MTLRFLKGDNNNLSRMLALLKGLHYDERGQGLVEYLLIIVFGCLGGNCWNDHGGQLHQQCFRQSGSENR